MSGSPLASMSSKENKAYKKRQAANLAMDIEMLIPKSQQKSRGGSPTAKPSGGSPTAKPEPTSVLKPVDLSSQTELERDDEPEISGLSDTRYCTNYKSLAKVVGAMVAHGLGYDNDTLQDLVKQFSYYFDKLGWDTEDDMADSLHENLPKLEDIISDVNRVTMIRPHMQLSIKRIAQYIVMVRDRNLFLRRKFF